MLAIVPFATIPFDKYLMRNTALEGTWRTSPSEDPRDQSAFDRLFRWFISRPALLIFVLLTAVIALFSFLLFLGPPTQWFD
jgi:hypothetical protein